VLDRHTAEQLVLDMFAVITHGDPELAIRCIHPDFVNEESANEPPACATPGPAGLAATGTWLRSAYSLVRKNKRVKQILQFQLVDGTPDQLWHTAIVDNHGRPMGAYAGLAKAAASIAH